MRHTDQFEFLASDAIGRTSSNAHGPSASSEAGGDGDLLRDTVAFHFGLVSSLLVERAFSHSEAVSRYLSWLREVGNNNNNEDERHELVRAGLGDDGSLQLVARPRVDEFLGYLEHPDFSALLSLAYSVAEREIIGIHLVGFSGKPMLATRWLRGLRRALLGRAHTQNISSFIN